MQPEFSGIERRLDELSERLARLRPLSTKTRAEFAEDPYLRDIAERNLEICAQCCIDVCHRVIALEQAQKPADYREAILRMGELGILPADFAAQLAPIASFRNILVHDYIGINWDRVHANLQDLNDLDRFADYIRKWLASRLTDT